MQGDTSHTSPGTPLRLKSLQQKQWCARAVCLGMHFWDRRPNPRRMFLGQYLPITCVCFHEVAYIFLAYCKRIVLHVLEREKLRKTCAGHDVIKGVPLLDKIRSVLTHELTY